MDNIPHPIHGVCFRRPRPHSVYSAALPTNARFLRAATVATAQHRFRILGNAAELSHQLPLHPGYHPRRQLRLAEIAAALPAALQQRLLQQLLLPTGHHGHGHVQQDRDSTGPQASIFEFDFTGCVVRVGEAQQIGGGGACGVQQWVFLADQTSGLCSGSLAPAGGGDGDGQTGGPGTGPGDGGGGLEPWMLAVKMVGVPVGVRGGAASSPRLPVASYPVLSSVPF